MENASKALIIAGAILLSILIIGLGMGIFNQSKNAMSTSSLDTAEINAHNSQFEQYEGKQKGSTVKQMINTIKSNNKSFQDRKIVIDFNNSTTAGTAAGWDGADPDNDPNGTYDFLANVKSNTTYFVTFTQGENSLINLCEVHIFSNADL